MNSILLKLKGKYSNIFTFFVILVKLRQGFDISLSLNGPMNLCLNEITDF